MTHSVVSANIRIIYSSYDFVGCPCIARAHGKQPVCALCIVTHLLLNVRKLLVKNI